MAKAGEALKYYRIETRASIEGIHSTPGHRYVSLYNGSRGVWRDHNLLARQDGEEHKALIIALHVTGKITSMRSLRALGVK